MCICTFSEEWMEDNKYCGWLKPWVDSCKEWWELCRKTFKLGRMGCKSLESYMKLEKHQPYASTPKTTMPIKPLAVAACTRAYMSTASVSATAKPSGPATTSHKTAFSTFFTIATVKEEVLSVKSTPLIHHSYTSKQDIHTVFKEMILESKSAKTFSCGMDKTIYLVQYGHAPDIKRSASLLINQLFLLLLLVD